MKQNDLIGKIQKAKEDYYNYGTSQLTDEEYDRLVKQAERLGYVETVGTSPVDNIPKIKHEHPMLSLDKIHSIFEVKKFIKDKRVIAMWKADGLSVSATYEDGILTRLVKRGDGIIGNDIMHLANSISNLPKVINRLGKFVIDGECVILQSDFDAINDTINVEDKYKNSRNLAAGSLNLLDSTEAAKRHLRFYAWDVIDGYSNDSVCANLIETNYLGFETVHMYMMSGKETTKDIENLLNGMKEQAYDVGFPIDGIVFKYDSVSFGKTLGSTIHHFNNAVAYKFEDKTYETTLIDIEWQVGKSGRITPIAVFVPITISGSVIEKASLHNISIMKKVLNKPFYGQKIWISKMNDVIPQIVGSIDDKGDFYGL